MRSLSPIISDDFWVKEPRRAETVSDENATSIYRTMRLEYALSLAEENLPVHHTTTYLFMSQ